MFKIYKHLHHLAYFKCNKKVCFEYIGKLLKAKNSKTQLELKCCDILIEENSII